MLHLDLQSLPTHVSEVDQSGRVICSLAKYYLTELITKSISISSSQEFFAYVHMLEFHVLFIWDVLACALRVNLLSCEEWQLIVQAVFPTPPLPLSTVYLMWWVPVFLSCVGAHDWVARICQPWERSPSRSWLPIMEAPRCFRHPTSN